MANFGIFDEDFLKLEGPDRLLLTDGVNGLVIFGASVTRDYRRFPDDGLRNHPGPVDLKRKWPQV